MMQHPSDRRLRCLTAPRQQLDGWVPDGWVPQIALLHCLAIWPPKFKRKRSTFTFTHLFVAPAAVRQINKCVRGTHAWHPCVAPMGKPVATKPTSKSTPRPADGDIGRYYFYHLWNPKPYPLVHTTDSKQWHPCVRNRTSGFRFRSSVCDKIWKYARIVGMCTAEVGCRMTVHQVREGGWNCLNQRESWSRRPFGAYFLDRSTLPSVF